MNLRPQCSACPWRDMPRMHAEHASTVAYAAAGNLSGWVCHTRMGPCDGPSHAGIVPVQVA